MIFLNKTETIKNRAFIFIIALQLLVFCFLVTLAFFILSRIQSRTNRSLLAEAQAREHALLALNTALGRLMEKMNGSFHATVQSDTLGTKSKNNAWTGMFAQDGNIAWMVSGYKSSPQATYTPDDTAIISYSHKRQPDVRVPKERLFDHNLNVTGHFAYWINDQSIKISWQRFIPPSARTEQINASVRTQRSHQELTHWWFDSNLTTADMKKKPDFEQLDRLLRKQYFHDITPSNNYTPIDPYTGRKKQILTPENARISDVHSLTNDALFSFLTIHVNGKDNALSTLSNHSFRWDSEYPVFNQIPVITECGLYLGLRKSRQTGNADLSMFIRIRVELWNPYGFPLAISPELKKWRITVEGLDELTVSWQTNNGLNHYGSRQLDLSKAINESSKTVTSLPNTIPGGSMLVRNCDIAFDLNETAIKCTRNKDYASLSTKQTELSFIFKTEDGSTLYRFEKIPFNAFHSNRYDKHKLSSSKAFDEYDNYITLYHFGRKDDIVAPDNRSFSDLEYWFLKTDIRKTRIVFPEEPELAGMFSVGKDPPFTYDIETHPFSGGQFFYAPLFSDPKRLFRIFDVTAFESQTLSHLQHLQIENKPSFSIGNPYGGKWNKFFDAFYPRQNIHFLSDNKLLTPIEKASDPLDETEENPGMFFSVSGAFNLNSTSVFAWKALLRGIDWTTWIYRTFYEKEPALYKSSIKNGFFRLRHAADRLKVHPAESYPDYPEWRDMDAIEWMYMKEGIPWLGAYSFASRELTMMQTDALSEAIVKQIKARGKAFFSISDFLNSGVLQAAIDATNINTLDGLSYRNSEEATRIPQMAPSYISQADLFALFSHRVCTRGETFVIRGYGDAYNPNTDETLARTYCEATVTFHPRKKQDTVYFEYELNDFRWLNPYDL